MDVQIDDAGVAAAEAVHDKAGAGSCRRSTTPLYAAPLPQAATRAMPRRQSRRRWRPPSSWCRRGLSCRSSSSLCSICTTLKRVSMRRGRCHTPSRVADAAARRRCRRTMYDFAENGGHEFVPKLRLCT